METKELLRVKDLKTSFRIKGNYYAAVDYVSFSIYENEVLAIVGESGCGKSALALSITQLHNMNYTRIEGEIFYKGRELLSLHESELEKIRGKELGMIFQDPLSALNPLMIVGTQIEESLFYHTHLNRGDRKVRAIQLLDEVGISDPARTYEQYPHELSGGMRQRAMIAIALACKPSLIVADEPTTALDVTIQAQILDLLRELQRETKAGIILITHDLGVVAETADRVAVMYGGQIVEIAEVGELFHNPMHPYTRSLLNSIPSVDKEVERLHVIEGMVPSLVDMPRTGCRFAKRIPWIPEDVHEHGQPHYHEITPNHQVLCTCYQHFRFRDKESEGNYGITES